LARAGIAGGLKVDLDDRIDRIHNDLIHLIRSAVEGIAGLILDADISDEVEQEDVAGAVGVVGNEVGGNRLERDIPAGGADGGRAAGVVALLAVSVDAHAADRVRAAVVDKDVRIEVQIVRHEVGGARGERDEAAVLGDRGGGAGGIGLDAPGREADTLDRVHVAVVDEDIPHAVCVFARLQEGRGVGLKRDVAPVAADGRRHAGAVTLHGLVGDAGALDRVGQAVIDEDVRDPVGVHARTQEVGRQRLKRHKAPVLADRRVGAGAVRLHAGGGDADALNGVGGAVIDEDVPRAVRVVACAQEIGGVGFEGHVPSVRADRGGEACAVSLCAAPGHAHALDRLGQAIIDEDVSEPISVPGQEVRRVGLEGHEAAVAADRRRIAGRIGLSAR